MRRLSLSPEPQLRRSYDVKECLICSLTQVALSPITDAYGRYRSHFFYNSVLRFYVAAKATYIRLLHSKIGFLGVFFGPSSVKWGRTHIVLG